MRVKVMENKHSKLNLWGGMKKAAGTVKQAIPTAYASPRKSVKKRGKRSLPLPKSEQHGGSLASPIRSQHKTQEETVNQSTSDHILESSPSAPKPNPGVSYFPELFVNFALPVRAPKVRDAEGTRTAVSAVQWERRNGHRTLTLTAGKIILPGTHESLTILPSGKVAVMILHWLCTESVRAGGPEIKLATNWHAFLNDIGIPWNSRNAREAERQLRALLAMRIDATTVKFDEDGDEIIHTISCLVGPETNLAFTRDGDVTDRKSTVVLSKEFYEGVVCRWPIPHGSRRWEQLAASTKSPLTLLLWLWLKHRLYSADRSGAKNQPVISWEELAGQLGPDFTRIRDFRESFIRSAREIATVDPHLIARVERVDAPGKKNAVTGIRLHPKNSHAHYKTITD